MASVIKVLLVTLLALMGAEGCERHDVPAGSAGGDSAGNNQPDGGGLQACSMPQPIQIQPVAYEQRAGIIYRASAYLMDEHCDIIDTENDKVMKVTLVATDASGRRLDPQHNAHPTPSPYTGAVTIAFPRGYAITLTAAINLTNLERETLGASFLACQIIPNDNTYPASIRFENISNKKVDCAVKG